MIEPSYRVGVPWSGPTAKNSCGVNTNKQLYYEGEKVQCTVCLNIVKPVTVTAIDCQLEGVEQTYCVGEIDFGGKSPLVNLWAQLGGVGRELAPGQYQWQVAFPLPAGLPSSFHIGTRDKWAAISYTVSLQFHTPGPLKRAIRSTHQLALRRHTVPTSQALRVLPVEKSVELPLVSCRCISRGVVSAHIRLDRDKAQPGETVHVILEMDNRSRLAVQGVELSLKREVLMRDKPASSRACSTQKMHAALAKTQHPGFQPFATLQGGQARRIQLSLPADLPPSMDRQLITCRYFVKAKLKMGSFVKDARVKVPLVVLPL